MLFLMQHKFSSLKLIQCYKNAELNVILEKKIEKYTCMNIKTDFLTICTCDIQNTYFVIIDYKKRLNYFFFVKNVI